MRKFIQSTLDYTRYLALYIRIRHTSEHYRKNYRENTDISSFSSQNITGYTLPSKDNILSTQDALTRESLILERALSLLLDIRITNPKLEQNIFEHYTQTLLDFKPKKPIIALNNYLFQLLSKKLREANWFGIEKTLHINPADIQKGLVDNQRFYRHTIDFISQACDIYGADKKETLSILGVSFLYSLVFQQNKEINETRAKEKLEPYPTHCWSEADFTQLFKFIYEPLHERGVYFSQGAQTIEDVYLDLTNNFQSLVNSLNFSEESMKSHHPLYFTSYFLMLGQKEFFSQNVEGATNWQDFSTKTQTIEKIAVEQKFLHNALSAPSPPTIKSPVSPRKKTQKI